ncbi:histidine kinase [Vagococcus penaei]|uniref:sensor histidine kinase n=1 Tax=Vagococcus penaei TaxID=633807 RepID=UPI00098650C8|nr:sensor histidine kinase KdpD [Vagococcus penaei]RSU05311.1 histidine kinase [Vagococcus penaei]
MKTRVTDTTTKKVSTSKKGILRIYFGYAAGVGKTYSMLKDAQELKSDGIDVVVGYVEPHKRPETMALQVGLEQLPLLTGSYRSKTLTEFDLDYALLRKPKLILIDELAHSNAPISRNKKRYQDVEELLNAGIDVFTTVNVQHLESLNDIIEKISTITVNERIPDTIFDQADQIELVDIDPTDLLDRLVRGKIYQPQAIERALENFFTVGKLVALREIALRKTADQVNRMANEQCVNQTSAYTREHILVCVSPSPSSLYVIRSAARLAQAFNAVLTGVYVEENESELLEDKRLTLHENIRLVEQLGGQITTLHGDNIGEQISAYAKASYVSKIVVGKSVRANWWSKKSIVDELTEMNPMSDIYVIPDKYQKVIRKKTLKPIAFPAFSISDSLKTMAILISCTLVGLLFNYWDFNISNIITVYILGVQLNAMVTTSPMYSVLSSILSVLTFNFIFTEPRFTFEAFSSGYPMTFFIMLVAGLITSSLTQRMKAHAIKSAEKAYRTELLFETNQLLQGASGIKNILRETGKQLTRLLKRQIIIYPVSADKLEEVMILGLDEVIPEVDTTQIVNERAVADWVLKNNKRAGATTNTLSGSHYLYLAIRNKDQVFAVIGISMHQQDSLESFEKSILMAILGESALSLEKEWLQEKQYDIATQIEKEQLRSNLLRAISHDLRTPLTAISGNAKLLLDKKAQFTNSQQQDVLLTISDDAIWLIHLVENLLSITKLDNQLVELNLQVDVIPDILDEAIRHADRQLLEREFIVDIQDELLLAKVDAQLFMQVIVNLLNNAVKYTSSEVKIWLKVRKKNHRLIIEVGDNGPGLSKKEKQHAFEPFFTGEQAVVDSRRGMGLGLSLCKSIIDAHDGSIVITDHNPHGTIITIELEEAEVRPLND